MVWTITPVSPFMVAGPRPSATQFIADVPATPSKLAEADGGQVGVLQDVALQVVAE